MVKGKNTMAWTFALGIQKRLSQKDDRVDVAVVVPVQGSYYAAVLHPPNDGAAMYVVQKSDCSAAVSGVCRHCLRYCRKRTTTSAQVTNESSMEPPRRKHMMNWQIQPFWRLQTDIGMDSEHFWSWLGHGNGHLHGLGTILKQTITRAITNANILTASGYVNNPQESRSSCAARIQRNSAAASR
eukprot:2567459-Pleurochrysis_carterae.AAC.2